MKIAVTKLESTSPYSQSRQLRTEKPDNMSHLEHDQKYAIERLWLDSNGHVYIPMSQFHKCLQGAAAYLKMQKKGQSTWTKHFMGGVAPRADIVLSLRATEVQWEDLPMSPGGKSGSVGGRVIRRYPLINSWSGTIEWEITDDEITKDVFLKHLECAGINIGIGRWRPRQGGLYGRFRVVDLKWKEVKSSSAA